MAEISTFERYADRLAGVAAAEAAGIDRAEIVKVIAELDRAVAQVDGGGFAPTPTHPQPALGRAVGLAEQGTLWVKDETGNVSGSHKGRHLFGVALGFALEDLIARTRGDEPQQRRLAIASCGNAALAAAVVAAATGHSLDVFVPDWADPAVVERITDLGATVQRCARTEGMLGDPAHHALIKAISEGATPFSCQGTETPTTIDGARTLAYELSEQVANPLDRIVLQVGGGALATAVVTGLAQCRPDHPMPILHVVQPVGNHPLVRAWDRIIAGVVGQQPSENHQRQQAADGLGPLAPEARASLVAELRADPGRFMEPWPDPPVSYASGILDDITYDWIDIVDAMLATGGFPVVADDPTFRQAHHLAASHTGIPVCPTGASGLAGVLVLVRDLGLSLAGEQVAVVFSGRQRPGDPLPSGESVAG